MSAEESSGEYESSSEEEVMPPSKAVMPPKAVSKVVSNEEVDEDDEDSDTDSDSGPPQATSNGRKEASSGSQAVAKAPPSIADNAGKRGRDANGGKPVSAEESNPKKRKEVSDDRTRPQAVLTRSEKVVKGDPAPKVSKAKSALAPAPPSKPEIVKQPPPASRKRRQSPPPSSSTKVAKVEKLSPLKPKKVYHWTPASELELANCLLRDSFNGTTAIPNTKGDSYWEKLLRELGLQGELNEVQLCEKVRRTKVKYVTLKERAAKEDLAKVSKKPEELRLYKIWDEIWGSGTEKVARPTKSQPVVEDVESDDESEGTPVRQGAVTNAGAAQAKEEDGSSEEEEDDEDEGTEMLIRKTADVNDIASDRKTVHDKGDGVSPFVSKPLLPFTPVPPKDEKKKSSTKSEEIVSGDQVSGEVLAGDIKAFKDELIQQMRGEFVPREIFGGDINAFKADLIQQIRGEIFPIVRQAIRGTCLPCVDGGFAGPGQFAVNNGFGNGGMTEDSGAGFLSQTSLEMQNKWRNYRIEELGLLAHKHRLWQEQCAKQQDELRLQTQMSTQQRN